MLREDPLERVLQSILLAGHYLILSPQKPNMTFHSKYTSCASRCLGQPLPYVMVHETVKLR